MDAVESSVKKRSRASIACNHCRGKRSKCDGVPGKQTCTQCRTKGIECEMSGSKRNRAYFKPQMDALTKRIQMLEKALASTPTSTVPIPMETHCQDQFSSTSELPNETVYWNESESTTVPSVPFSSNHDFYGKPSSGFSQPAAGFAEAPSVTENVSEASIPQLSPPFSHGSQNSVTPIPAESQNTIAEPAFVGIFPSLGLTAPVVDYLLGLFFHRYQMMLKFVVQRDFMAQKAAGTGPMFRTSLMLSMMAAGLRYSTRREVTEAYLRPDGENIIATVAKKALEPELFDPKLTTVQALLILAEVEAGVGHAMTAHMYWTKASNLIFELSLNLGTSMTTVLSDEEIALRHWLLWVASVGDQYWAVSLRRTPAIKTHTLQVSRLAARFARNGNHEDVQSSISTYEQHVNESVLDLMEIAREVTSTLYNRDLQQETSSLAMTVSKLHQRLHHWFERLPERIKRKPISGEDSYHFVFVLHLMFNVVKVVLHRDLAFSSDLSNLSGRAPTVDPAVWESRAICADSASQIAKIFETFRRREDIRTLQCTGVQWATVAANVLISYVSSIPVEEAVEAIAHLQSLSRTLKEMSKTFQPALQPYDEVCRCVRLSWSALNNDDGTGNQLLHSSLPSGKRNLPPPPKWPSEGQDIQHEASMNMQASSLDGSIMSSFQSPSALTVRSAEEQSHEKESQAHTIPHAQPGTISESWSESWEWEDLLHR